jgi:hypothetical protein
MGLCICLNVLPSWPVWRVTGASNRVLLAATETTDARQQRTGHVCRSSKSLTYTSRSGTDHLPLSSRHCSTV